MLLSIITSLHIFICVLLIVLVLLQQGKGADAGVTLGGGGNTVFGAAGADNFITRFTTILACCFMITSVYLGVQSKPGSPAEGRLFKDVAASAPVVSSAASSAAATNSSASDNLAPGSPIAETSSETVQSSETAPVSEVSAQNAASSSVATQAPQAVSSEAPTAQ